MKTTRRQFITGLFAVGVATAVPLPSFEEKRSDLIVCDDPWDDSTTEDICKWWSDEYHSRLDSAKDVHVDRTLTDISVAYLQESDGFISSKVFPVVQGDSYFLWTNCVA